MTRTRRRKSAHPLDSPARTPPS